MRKIKLTPLNDCGEIIPCKTLDLPKGYKPIYINYHRLRLNKWQAGLIRTSSNGTFGKLRKGRYLTVQLITLLGYCIKSEIQRQSYVRLLDLSNIIRGASRFKYIIDSFNLLCLHPNQINQQLIYESFMLGLAYYTDLCNHLHQARLDNNLFFQALLTQELILLLGETIPAINEVIQGGDAPLHIEPIFNLFQDETGLPCFALKQDQIIAKQPNLPTNLAIA